MDAQELYEQIKEATDEISDGPRGMYRYCVDCDIISGYSIDGFPDDLPDECRHHTTVYQDSYECPGIYNWLRCLEYLLEE